MIVLCVILVLILLFLIIPVGVDAAYEAGNVCLKVKIAFARITILPRKAKAPKPEGETKKKEKTAADEKAPEEKKPKLKLGVSDVLELLKIGLKALGRLRRQLSIDLFRLYVTVAADDPYDAVMRYGYLNAALASLAPLARRAFKLRQADVKTAVDLEGGENLIDAHFVASYQIWELFYIGLCAGLAALRWYLGKRREMKKTNENEAPEQTASEAYAGGEKG